MKAAPVKLSPEERGRQWLVQSLAMDHAKRRQHPRQALLLDAIVGAVGVAVAGFIFLSYLGVIG